MSAQVILMWVCQALASLVCPVHGSDVYHRLPVMCSMAGPQTLLHLIRCQLSCQEMCQVTSQMLAGPVQ